MSILTVVLLVVLIGLVVSVWLQWRRLLIRPGDTVRFPDGTVRRVESVNTFDSIVTLDGGADDKDPPRR
jgi:hypothetical protein